MDIYLVGGAVRDHLLGRPVVDRDWVVVGATPEDMLSAGYKAVGKDFPVFLHGDTKEEYALARTERKTGRGYHGFAFHADPGVTVEQDLERRDLTINAIAQHEDGSLVDPFGGVADIASRTLRHVSQAFVEDPVRLLRVARFAARYAPLGFRVADETMALMRRMVDDGEIDHLVPERVWAETRKALSEPAPSVFLQVLRESGALRVLFPEVDALYGVPQRPEFHPEVDTGIHIELVLDAAARLAPGDALVGWCALTHDLGKALTPPDVLPRHIMHEQRGVEPVRAISARLKVPVEYASMAELVCKHHLNAHMAFELKPSTILRLLDAVGSLRRPERLETFLLACMADKQGRLGSEEAPYPQANFLRACRMAAAAITSQPFVEKGLQGPAIGEAMKKAQAHAIASVPKPAATPLL
ncbi:multifunctional CCA addition/repair protein [Luteibacter sp. dw_328]|uniref:multifunctional CCA addition/repair protein n=1 Tax=Luteibacter sp. dw_328 TaxID=2719796 RepID=UPI001BD43FF8|nr:multifunctional CCA addition/repair protein [Luteibacter sp. dw_328]